MRPIRVLLVDDQPALLTALQTFLAGQPRIRVVGKARSGPEGIAQAASTRPDLVLLDLVMPGMNGLEALPGIKALPDAPRVVLVTFQDEPELRAAAGALGADGFVAKPELSRRLLPLVEALFPPGTMPRELTAPR